MSASSPRPARPWPTPGLSFGGDYNPEQWPSEVWREDLDLMVEAGVNIVTLGVFSWATVERRPGEFDWAATDEIVGLLHERGIRIDMATPTAAPPPWLHALHPEILPRDRDLIPQFPGARLGWCPSSPVFRDHSLRVTRELAQRYAPHPAVAMWHVSNELGGGNGRCYCEVSAAAFRDWLRRRYASVDVLNHTWGTAFWGHIYSDFDEVNPPRGSEAQNPALVLDFDRFSSDELLGQLLAERDVIREADPDAIVTTNFMVGPAHDVVDYPRWAAEVDVVANDHYTLPTDPLTAQDIAFSGDRMRNLAPEKGPWLLMEHSTSHGTWHPVNRAKAPRELIRNSLGHIARGADGALFFQWRSSPSGAEQYFPGMVPHSGTDSKIWRETVELGQLLGRIGEIAGTTVPRARVALLFDDIAGWALTRGLKPRHGLDYGRIPRAWHRAFWERNIPVDVVGPWADLAGYEVVVVPTLLLVSDADAANIASVVDRGGCVLVTHLSGIVDENDRVRLGGFPGAFRELLGASSEEFFPLRDGETVLLDTGWLATEWTELMREDPAAEVVAHYAAGPLRGRPAVTRNPRNGGSAWYVSASIDRLGIDAVVARLIAENALRPILESPEVEAVRRSGDGRSYLFLLNHSDRDVEVPVGGRELVTGIAGAAVTVPAGEVRIVREGERTGTRES
ncbi:MAG TPA: beta-galactosidase [Lacisediminihabitans sp.]|uniref:beta-galactosidase n=1 Tax=Lacisediminihabitans sp. TaxID=2787631 RepID=UPI002EDB4A6B